MLYPGAVITDRVPAEIDGQRVYRMETADDPDSVAAFYEKIAKDRGCDFIDSGAGRTRLISLKTEDA